jgi:hypothetical protein
VPFFAGQGVADHGDAPAAAVPNHLSLIILKSTRRCLSTRLSFFTDNFEADPALRLQWSRAIAGNSATFVRHEAKQQT